MEEKLLEPVKYYNEYLKDAHLKNIEELFDNLVKESNINVEENRETVKKYKDKINEIANFDKKLKKYNLLNTILSIFVIFVGIYACYSVYSIYSSKKLMTLKIIIIVLLIGVCIYFSYLLIKKIKPTIKDVKNVKTKNEEESKEIQNECFKQMAPLNRLFDSDHTRQLIMKTLPDIAIDKNMEMERFEILSEKYGLADVEKLKDISVQEVLSGEIIGNPYVMCRSIGHTLGEYTYTGSLTITWETYSYDSDGNMITHHHSQVLHASLTKPKPYYSQYISLYYGNEAASNLCFSRTPNHIEKLNDKALTRKIKDDSKMLQKKAKEAMKNGDNFTPVGNDEFDVLFNALNRDNEAEFRLIFTPLAQKNMLDLLKKSMFGDDFYFEKDHMLNTISSEHSYNWDTNTFGQRFSNYDIDDSRKRFRDFQIQYFDHFYFQIAPLLSIPLYQQHKPREYIYKHDYKRNYSSYQTEVLANIMGTEYFRNPNTKTDTILKTHYDYSNDKTDTVTVDAYSYDAFDRVDYISVYGDDGYYHDVPVNWVEYIPLKQQSSMRVKRIDITDDQFNEIKFKKDFNESMLKHNGVAYGYEKGMLSLKVSSNAVDEDIDKDFDILFKINKQQGGE